jgi:uncharacterized protein DUF4112
MSSRPLDSSSPSAHPTTEESVQRDLERIERLAHWMDQRYIDPILGLLLPGVGDVLGAGVGLFAIVSAFRLRAHPVVIARMFINLAIDSVIGAIPLVGAVLDFFYKAHTRNLRLIKTRDLREPRASDWVIVGAAAFTFVLALCLPIIVLVMALRYML